MKIKITNFGQLETELMKLQDNESRELFIGNSKFRIVTEKGYKQFVKRPRPRKNEQRKTNKKIKAI